MKHIIELIAHQDWADAEHWKAIEQCDAALNDAQLKTRLHHLHFVQHAFLAILRSDPAFSMTKPEDFATMNDLKLYAIRFHEEMQTLQISEALLAKPVTIPWFKNPPLTLSAEHAIMQQTMHSHYHRAQNATRLRELGGEPPLTDFIVWIWKGQPEAHWS
jgi:uncharacterized damage-inducible protein DinB